MNLSDLVEAIPGFGTIAQTFGRMEIAEEEIAAARKCYPARVRSRVDGSFGVLCPSPVLRDRGDELYRAHVREMIDRCVRGEDCRRGTDAEVLAVVLASSLKAPLARDAQAVAEKLFARLFPGKADEFFAGDLATPTYPGADEELVEQVRRMVYDDDRRTPGCPSRKRRGR